MERGAQPGGQAVIGLPHVPRRSPVNPIRIKAPVINLQPLMAASLTVNPADSCPANTDWLPQRLLRKQSLTHLGVMPTKRGVA